MPPRKKREHRRTNPESWQNDLEKPSDVNRTKTKGTSEAAKLANRDAYLNHPKNAQGVNICYASLSNGKHCQLAAGRMTDHEGYGKCSLHGGNTPTLRTNAAMYVGGEIIHRMTNAYGLGGPMNIDPHEALLQEVRRGSGYVGFLADRLNTYELDIGNTLLTPQKRELIELLQKERLMLVKVAKTAIDAGIAEQRVQLERAKGVQLVEVLREVFDGLGLSVDQQRLLPTLVPMALRKLTEPQATPLLEQPKHLHGG